MYKKAKIIFFCMVFVVGSAFSQNHPVKAGRLLLLQPVFNSTFHSATLINPNINTRPKPVIEPNFYVMNLGFFCKQEIKFEKATKIAFRFRLGTVEECDRMEGKQTSTYTAVAGRKLP